MSLPYHNDLLTTSNGIKRVLDADPNNSFSVKIEFNAGIGCEGYSDSILWSAHRLAITFTWMDASASVNINEFQLPFERRAVDVTKFRERIIAHSLSIRTVELVESQAEIGAYYVTIKVSEVFRTFESIIFG